MVVDTSSSQGSDIVSIRNYETCALPTELHWLAAFNDGKQSRTHSPCEVCQRPGSNWGPQAASQYRTLSTWQFPTLLTLQFSISSCVNHTMIFYIITDNGFSLAPRSTNPSPLLLEQPPPHQAVLVPDNGRPRRILLR